MKIHKNTAPLCALTDSRMKKNLQTRRILAILALLIFAILLFSQLAKFESIQKFDEQVSLSIFRYRNNFLNQVFLFITKLGDPFSLLLVGICTVLFSSILQKEDSFPIWFAITLLFGALVLSNFFKFLVARPRPAEIFRLVHISSYSFPSGHALDSTLAYGGIGYLISRFMDRGKYGWKKRALLLPAILLPLVIAFSRIYLGVHFFTDVLAGLGLGTGVLFFSINLLESYQKNTIGLD